MFLCVPGTAHEKPDARWFKETDISGRLWHCLGVTSEEYRGFLANS